MPWAITKWSPAQRLIEILWLLIKFTYKTHLRAYQFHHAQHPQIDILVSSYPSTYLYQNRNTSLLLFARLPKNKCQFSMGHCEMRYAPPINAEIADCSEGGNRSNPWVWHEAARSPANVKAFCPTSAAIELAMLSTLASNPSTELQKNPQWILHCVYLRCRKIDFRVSATASIRLVQTLYEVSRKIYHYCTQNLGP